MERTQALDEFAQSSPLQQLLAKLLQAWSGDPMKIPALAAALRRQAVSCGAVREQGISELALLDYEVQFGTIDNAQHRLRKVLNFCRANQLERLQGEAYHMAGRLFLRTEEYEVGLGYWDKAYQCALGRLDRTAQGVIWADVCEVFLTLDQGEMARRYGVRAQKLLSQAKSKNNSNLLRVELGLVQADLMTGELSWAKKRLARCEASLSDGESTDLCALHRLLTLWLKIELGTGDAAALTLVRPKDDEVLSAQMRMRVEVCLAHQAILEKQKKFAKEQIERLSGLPLCGEDPILKREQIRLWVQWCQNWGSPQQKLEAYEQMFAAQTLAGQATQGTWARNIDDRIRHQFLKSEGGHILLSGE